MKKPIIVNLFGGPGCGKSTLAAFLFSVLKMDGQYIVELVTEYAKDLAYEGRLSGGYPNWPDVLGNQVKRLERVRDTVDIIITDSPLLLSSVYCESIYSNTIQQMIQELMSNCGLNNTINYLIRRDKPYKEYGRSQTEEEAMIIDEDIQRMLDKVYLFSGNSYYAISSITNIESAIVTSRGIINHIKLELEGDSRSEEER